MAVPWTYENAAHLLRRVAFGGTTRDIEKFYGKHGSVESAVNEMLSFKPSKRRPPVPKDDRYEDKLKIQRWWTKQMLRQRRPSGGTQEKLVLFWHTHLVSGGNVLREYRWLSYQNQLFRLNARGNFKALVREFNRDPANLYYLDGLKNRASDDGIHVNANENFGRELMELFTLGVFQLQDDGTQDPTKPNYTEDDVHNLSRACTGWMTIEKAGKFYKGIWRESKWDGGRYDDDGDGLPDPMELFGQTSNGFRIDEGVAGTPDDVLELIFSRTDDSGNNQVAMHLARRLWTFYAYPPPAPGLKALFAGFASELAANNFELTPMLRAMWTSDEFFSDAARTRAIKNPCDFVIGSLKALGVRGNGREVGDSNGELGEVMGQMGMDLFFPPNVAGWPSGLGWINSGTLLQRFDFARALTSADWGPSRLRLKRIKSLPWKNPAADPDVVLDTLLRELGLDFGPLAIGGAQRDYLMNFLTSQGTQAALDFSNEFTDDVMIRVRGLISLMLQAAEYQIA